VIGLDLITKLTAVRFAPAGAPIMLLGDEIEIQLIENATLLGTAVRKTGSLSQIFISGIATLGLSAGGLAMTSAHDRPLKKFLVVSGILVGAWLSLCLPIKLPTLQDARLVGISRMFGVMTLNALLLRIVLNKTLFTASAAVTSAGLANISSAIWHPAGIIDFIWIRRLARIMGVGNVADMAMIFTVIALELAGVVWLFTEAWWRLAPARRRRGALGSFLRSRFTAG